MVVRTAFTFFLMTPCKDTQERGHEELLQKVTITMGLSMFGERVLRGIKSNVSFNVIVFKS